MKNSVPTVAKRLLSTAGLMLLFSVDLSAQEGKDRSWSLNGYVKNMTSASLIADSSLIDNLVHNRLNFKWYMNDHFKFVAEMRNRVFIGDQLKNPFFEEGLELANDYFDLSVSHKNEDNYLFHFMMDRLYLQYTKNDLELKAGRQRINWGINSVWNPNDIFNAFSFFDFDHEERPGSDAFVARYYTGIASSIEIAGKMANNFDEFTGAALWKLNHGSYDYQILAGMTNRNIVIGGGWAGNIKKAGFKGEGSYFYPAEEALDQNKVLAATIALEYSFKNSLFLNGSILYSSNGSVNPSDLDLLLYYSGNIAAKYLSPYLWSAFVQSGYQFHPLLTGGMAIIGYPGNTDAFLGPFVTFSLLQDLDMDFFAQVLAAEVNDSYQVTTQLYYLRFKYSF